jgi:hypothetical protein
MQVKQLKPHFNKMLPKATWNFDLTDCDKILRVDSGENVVSEIIDLLHLHHYSCEELT